MLKLLEDIRIKSTTKDYPIIECYAIFEKFFIEIFNKNETTEEENDLIDDDEIFISLFNLIDSRDDVVKLSKCMFDDYMISNRYSEIISELYISLNKKRINYVLHVINKYNLNHNELSSIILIIEDPLVREKINKKLNDLVINYPDKADIFKKFIFTFNMKEV